MAMAPCSSSSSSSSLPSSFLVTGDCGDCATLSLLHSARGEEAASSARSLLLPDNAQVNFNCKCQSKKYTILTNSLTLPWTLSAHFAICLYFLLFKLTRPNGKGAMSLSFSLFTLKSALSRRPFCTSLYSHSHPQTHAQEIYSYRNKTYTSLSLSQSLTRPRSHKIRERERERR